MDAPTLADEAPEVPQEEPHRLPAAVDALRGEDGMRILRRERRQGPILALSAREALAAVVHDAADREEARLNPRRR